MRRTSAFIAIGLALMLPQHATAQDEPYPSRPVRVITRAPDVYQNVGISVIETPTLVLEVRVSDCPALVPGDQFMIDGILYAVQGSPRRDSERLVWQADVYAS